MLLFYMKSAIVILFLGLFMFSVDAKFNLENVQIIEHTENGHQSLKNSSLCEPCVSFIGNGINQILNTILKGGIVGGCNELCSKSFPDKPHEEQMCNLLCDTVGVYSFIHIVQKYSGYLDPIYFCETLHVCPVHDGGKVNLNGLTITPSSGKVGATFQIEALITVLNQTSTGEIVITVTPPSGEPFGDSILDTGFTEGNYDIKFSLKTDPTEQEAFTPGEYQVVITGCDGVCGSKLPHTYTLFEGKTNFTIVSA